MKLLSSMKAAAIVLVAAALAVANPAQSQKAKVVSDKVVSGKVLSGRERLIGTWHLVKIDSPTTDGQPQPPLPLGLMIFTADGHEAVQLMYPKEASTLNNKFVHDGYEASFGTFEMDEAKHVLRYHPVASATRDAFVGTDELLQPTFQGEKQLVMRPADPDQHWSVTWEKY